MLKVPGVLHLGHHGVDINTQLGRDPRAVVHVDAEEVAEHAHLHVLAGLAQTTSDAAGQAIAMRVVEHAVEVARLGVVIVIDGAVVTVDDDFAQLPRGVSKRRIGLGGRRVAVGPVVGS